MTFAFIFSDVGVGEWFVLLAVILIVVGPKRLPETARKVGQYSAKLRRAADNFKRQLMDMDAEITRAADEVASAGTPAAKAPSPVTDDAPKAVSSYADDYAEIVGSAAPASAGPEQKGEEGDAGAAGPQRS